jgi:hypothetical protein
MTNWSSSCLVFVILFGATPLLPGQTLNTVPVIFRPDRSIVLSARGPQNIGVALTAMIAGEMYNWWDLQYSDANVSQSEWIEISVRLTYSSTPYQLVLTLQPAKSYFLPEPAQPDDHGSDGDDKWRRGLQAAMRKLLDKNHQALLGAFYGIQLGREVQITDRGGGTGWHALLGLIWDRHKQLQAGEFRLRYTQKASRDTVYLYSCGNRWAGTGRLPVSIRTRLGPNNATTTLRQNNPHALDDLEPVAIGFYLNNLGCPQP